jgi:hypothetical protein
MLSTASLMRLNIRILASGLKPIREHFERNGWELLERLEQWNVWNSRDL